MSDLSMPAAHVVNATLAAVLTETVAIWRDGFQFLGGPKFAVDHWSFTVYLPPAATALDMLRGLLQLQHGKGREDYAERDMVTRLRAAESPVNA